MLPTDGAAGKHIRRPVKKISTNLNQEQSDSNDTEQNTNTSPKLTGKSSDLLAASSKPRLLLYLGRILLVSLLVTSTVAVFSISSSHKTSQNWPWGFWYVVSFVFDQLVVLPFISLLQSMLVYRYLLGKPGKLLTFVVEKLISSDILNALKARRKLLQ